MYNAFLKTIIATLTYFILSIFGSTVHAQEFQGKAYFLSKSNMSLGKWGDKLSELQKKTNQSKTKKQVGKVICT
jgi:hypothetical protein